jgi:hypothetical protein
MFVLEVATPTALTHLKEFLMFRRTILAALLLSPASTFAAQDVAHAVSGTVQSVDHATKVVVVKTSDGADHAFRYTAKTTIHGTKEIEKGSRVAVHYTAAGGRDTAHEFDKLGDGGLKVIKGTVKHVDRATRKVSIATDEGTVETFHLTLAATGDATTAIGHDTAKTAKVPLYYTEDAGRKTGHFIERL